VCPSGVILQSHRDCDVLPMDHPVDHRLKRRAFVYSGKLTLAEDVELALRQNVDIQIANTEAASRLQDGLIP